MAKLHPYNGQHIDADIIVVGAGLVGLAAAIALAKIHKNVVLVDAKANAVKASKFTDSAAWDERVYALTLGTVKWLESLDIWSGVDKNRVNKINAMHIWDAETVLPLVLSDDDANLPTLGLMIENQNLMHALWQQIHTLNVTIIRDVDCKQVDYTENAVHISLEEDIKLTAKLLVAGDGAHSWLRQQANIGVKQKSFNQTAIVANFLAEKNHQNIARQWFAPHDILALLPLPQQHVAIVWSVSTEKAAQLLALPHEQLADKVQKKSGQILGALTLVSAKANEDLNNKDLISHHKLLSFALCQQTALRLIAQRVVLIGDAAHQIHPMAGQGVNLGFRDVIALAKLLASAHAMQDIGENTFLRQYERSRRADIATMNTLTTGLDYLFASEQPTIKKITHWGLQQLKSQVSIKKLLIKQAAA